MAEPASDPARVKRSIGVLGLTFISVSGILGSGWLFSPQLTSSLAGPASIISWGIGAVAMVLIATSFAEVSSVLPVPGGVARIPHFTHGDITAAVIGWTAWVGYSTQAPIEVAVMLQYAGGTWPWLFDGPPTIGHLTNQGLCVAGAFLLFFVAINALGAQAFARANTSITWLKIAIPIVIAVAFFSVRFEPGNYSAHGGFAPFGIKGILAAVTNGGVVFALIGFRHAIDMAGEARNPRTAVPIAIMLGLLIPVSIYLLIQVTFIGALTPGDLQGGWQNLHFSSRLGPLAAVSMTLGLSWLTAVVYGGAILGPLGGGLVATGSNGRLAYALARNHFLPGWFEKLSLRSIPLRTLGLNLAIGLGLLALLPFRSIVSVNSAAITLSFTAGPLAVYALRRQFPEAPRSLRLPAMPLQAVLGFVIASFIIYWSGWQTNQLLIGVIGTAVLFLAIKRLLIDRRPYRSLDWREAIWLVPFVASTLGISYLGNFGGGLGVIPFGWDLAILAVAGALNFWIAAWCRLPDDKAAAYRERYRQPDVPLTELGSESEPA